jgi:hypothetical protein
VLIIYAGGNVLPKRSAHLTRTIIEGLYNYSPYRGGQLTYKSEYDPQPQIAVDLISKIDVHRAIKAESYQNKKSRCSYMSSPMEDYLDEI